MGSTDNWCSPPQVAEPLLQFYDGPVGLDPCGNEHSIIAALVTYWRNALMLPWHTYRTSYENPPYSELDEFTDKALLEVNAAWRAKVPFELVRLVPVATSTGWHRRMVGLEPVVRPVGGRRLEVPLRRKPTVIFTKRLKFIDDTGVQAEGARFDSVLTYYGPRRAAFLREFRSITSWVPTL